MLGFECTINPQNLIKIVEAIFEKIKILNLFLMWTTLHFRGRGKTKKKRVRDICERTLDIDFERDWWDGLGPALGDGKKFKIYFSSFRDFSGKNRKCHIVGLRMYYKPTTFNQNRYSNFWESQNLIFFLMWTTLNFRGRGKTKKLLEIFASGPKILNLNEIGQLV